MALYVLRRTLLSIPTLVIASMLIFLLIHLAPGGPVRVMLGPMQDEALVAQLREQLGLNLPIYQQYLRWAGQALQGDFGNSVTIQRGAPVAELIGQRFLVTVELATLSLLIAIAIAIPTGVISALRQDRLADHAARVVALLGVSIPNFFLGIVLILLFGVTLRLSWGAGGFTPISEGLGDNLLSLLLPAVALGTAFSAIIMRMMRSSMLDVMGQDYVRTARAMGVRERAIVARDITRNALIPVITVIGNSFGYLLGGSIVTETLFRLPGIGNLIITGVFRRDFPVIQGVVLSIVVVYVIVNLLVDLTYALLDPRIRFGGSR